MIATTTAAWRSIPSSLPHPPLCRACRLACPSDRPSRRDGPTVSAGERGRCSSRTSTPTRLAPAKPKTKPSSRRVSPDTAAAADGSRAPPPPPPPLLSTSERGTRFEVATMRLLRRAMGMRLDRVGGAGDGGVDLVGWWTLPPPPQPPPPPPPPSPTPLLARVNTGGSESTARHEADDDGKDADSLARGKGHAPTPRHLASPRSSPSSPTQPPSPPPPIRVVAQCKAEAKKLGPVHVRELEGTLFRLASRAHVFPSPLPSSSSSSSSSLSMTEPDAKEAGEEEKLAGGAADAASQKCTTTTPTTPTPLLGVLASRSGFSKASVVQARASGFPLLLLQHAGGEEGGGGEEGDGARGEASDARAMLLNDALAEGLLRGRGEVRWWRSVAPPTRPSPREERRGRGLQGWGGAPSASQQAVSRAPSERRGQDDEGRGGGDEARAVFYLDGRPCSA